MTVAAEVRPGTGRAARRAQRKVRRATLRLRFEAMPLFGPARRGKEMTIGRTTAVRRFARFDDLPAQAYSGVVRYRWVRGKKTVLSGVVRTRRGRAAGRRGRAFCGLRVGRRPVDRTPPFVLPVPWDAEWKRGPLDVVLYAVDDLSGVAAVYSRLDGGALRTGRHLQVASEGSHELAYSARDAAGNQTPFGTVTLRVDMNPPTAANVTAPSGTTGDSTPEVRWDAASDSASGVRAYWVVIRDSNAAVVFSAPLAADQPRAVTVTQELTPGQYRAEVIAFDGAAPDPFTSTGTSSFAVVSADGGGPDRADSDGDGILDAEDNCPFAANPDQADTGGSAAGDACDDRDGDGVVDASDNCVSTPNPGQQDFNADGRGDHCQDTDGDGLLDHEDACPTVRPTIDINRDGCQG